MNVSEKQALRPRDIPPLHSLPIGRVRRSISTALALPLGSLLRGSGSGSSSRSSSSSLITPLSTLSGGIPVLASGGLVPASTGGTSEAGRGSLPVTTSGSEAALDSLDTLLIDTRELLLLNLLLSLSLGITVC